MLRDDESLIRQLASSYGMSDYVNTKYSESQFDPSTGTLYCEGVAIPKSTVYKALEYYKKQMECNRTLSTQNSMLMEQYLFSTVAFNAISMLIDNIHDK